jgi:hypothetical protein
MRWLGLTTILALGCALIGYGLLPILATDMTAQEHIIGGAMICAGLACLIFVGANIKHRVR